jgi:hypothetical protein
MTDILDRELSKRTNGMTGKQEMARKIIALALDGNFPALRYIFDRLDGSPIQAQKIDLPGSISIGLPPDNFDTITEKLERLLLDNDEPETGQGETNVCKE